MKKLEDWQDIIFQDWPELHITKESIRKNVRYSRRYGASGNVRLATGRVYTDAEYEARRKRVLAMSLP